MNRHPAPPSSADVAVNYCRHDTQKPRQDAPGGASFIVLSVPGIGATLGAEFLAAVGGDLDEFDSPDALAAFAGVAPAPRDSGKVSGNLHRPVTYHRRLQRVFYTSALVSVRHDPNSRKFYDCKRAEGKKHVQAVLALARRRVNVIWALIRDRRCYQVTPPVSAAAWRSGHA